MLKEDVITAIYQRLCKSTIWLNSSSITKLGNCGWLDDHSPFATMCLIL